MGWDGPVISAGVVQEPRKLGSPVEQGTGQAGVPELQSMRLSFFQDLRVTGSYAPVRAPSLRCQGHPGGLRCYGLEAEVEHPPLSITSSRNGERYGASICHSIPGERTWTAPVVLGYAAY